MKGFTVPEVRRGLNLLRQTWATQTLYEPICFSSLLFKGKTIESFSVEYFIGHHRRKCDKGKEKHRQLKISRQRNEGNSNLN